MYLIGVRGRGSLFIFGEFLFVPFFFAKLGSLDVGVSGMGVGCRDMG